jgi:hypothetical protein
VYSLGKLPCGLAFITVSVDVLFLLKAKKRSKPSPMTAIAMAAFLSTLKC